MWIPCTRCLYRSWTACSSWFRHPALEFQCACRCSALLARPFCFCHVEWLSEGWYICHNKQMQLWHVTFATAFQIEDILPALCNGSIFLGYVCCQLPWIPLESVLAPFTVSYGFRGFWQHQRLCRYWKCIITNCRAINCTEKSFTGYCT
jgi:hypothetical protein